MTSAGMNVTHLRSVAIATPDPDGLAEFYDEVWGLAVVARHSGTTYLRGAGDEHHILSIAPGQRAQVVGYTLGLPDASSVDAAASLLRNEAGALVDPPAPLDAPGGGYGMTVTDPDGRLVGLSAGVEAHRAPAPARPVAPVKISHIVVNSAQLDVYQRFLVDMLGFTLADEMPHMSFYRCNADHHSIAVTRAPHASLNHIAFELATTGDVLRGVQRLRDTVPLVWGPNRHGPGNNVFAYFAAPNGQVIEYTSEIEQIDVDHPPAPRLWMPEDSRVVDEWADTTTLRPAPEARQAMLGEPEPPRGPAWKETSNDAAHQ